MPDEPPVSTIERLFDKLLKFAGPILLAYIATLATRGNIKVDAVEERVGGVEQRQSEAAESSAAVKTKLEEKTVKDAAKQKDEDHARAVNLYGMWKYLDGVAELSGSQRDREAADNAKKLYDEFTKKKP